MKGQLWMVSGIVDMVRSQIPQASRTWKVTELFCRITAFSVLSLAMWKVQQGMLAVLWGNAVCAVRCREDSGMADQARTPADCGSCNA
jgi:hypothetical protein